MISQTQMKNVHLSLPPPQLSCLYLHAIHNSWQAARLLGGEDFFPLLQSYGWILVSRSCLRDAV